MFLRYGLDSFKKSCSRFINFGLMDRLFGNFDFFSVFDRDASSAQARRFMKDKRKFQDSQKSSGKTDGISHKLETHQSYADHEAELLESAHITDLNGITYFAQDSSRSESDDEFGCGDISRPRHHDYEMFIMGFYYFFVLQDPFIMQFLDFQSMRCSKELKNFKFSVM